MNSWIVTISLSLVCAFTVPSAAQQIETPKLPSTDAGQRVVAYIKAFNSGDEQEMRAFISANVSEDALRRRSIDERLQIYKEMLANMKSFELNRVIEDSSSSVTGLFRSGNGEWLEIGFQFEPESPHKLLGLRIKDSEPPSGVKAPSPTVGGPQSKMSEAEFLAAIEKRLNELVGADQFSGSVLIAKNGKKIFQKAYGLASKEYNVVNGVDTKFNLGSINKIFTQVAIGQLAEQGKLSFDDKLAKHLSDYPNRQAAERITIRQLLSMTSGVGDIFGARFELLAKDKLRSLKDFVPLFANEPLLFEPGSKQQYSNGGYVLLGAIIERLSGQSYYDYVQEHIFKVAGMENTDSYEADAVVPNLASGYTREGNSSSSRRNNIYFRPARGSSAGGGYSTTSDLLKFTIAVQNEKLRIPDFRSTGSNTDAGRRGREGLGIAGGAPGTNAILELNPENGYTVIILSNYDPPSAETIGREFRQWIGRIK